MLSAKRRMNQKRRLLEAKRQSDEWDLFQSFFTSFFKGGKKKKAAKRASLSASATQFEENITELAASKSKTGKAVPVAIGLVCLGAAAFAAFQLKKKLGK